MKDLNSKVENVNKSASSFLEAVDFYKLIKILEKKVEERKMPGVDYDKAQEFLNKIRVISVGEAEMDLGMTKLILKVVERTAKHARINIDCAGIKNMNLWVQALPIDENNCKIRLRIEYEFSLSPIGLVLRSTLTEEEIQDILNTVVEEIHD